MKAITKSLLVLSLILLHLQSYAQYEITYWRDVPHSEDESSDHHHETAVYEINCGEELYFVRKAGISFMDIGMTIRNTGNEELSLSLPLTFSEETSDLYSVVSAPSSGLIEPGTEKNIHLRFTYPSDYAEYDGAITLMQDDGGDAICQLNLATGVPTVPMFSKVFSPDVIFEGEESTLTFSIENYGGSATMLDFTDNLPSGMVIASPANTSVTCIGGTLTAVSGTSVITYTNGTSNYCGTCTISVDVVGNMAGVAVNTSGDLTSSRGNSGTATDNLTVNPLPSFSKTFNPQSIRPGGMSTLTFTIDNSSSSSDATNFTFDDNLPAGVLIANPSNASTTCTGGILDANPGTSSILYAGASVGAGATCALSIDVTSSVTGTHRNTSGNLTVSGIEGDSAVSDLIVYDFGSQSENKLQFGDPCNCEDPLNCESAGVYYFHDTVTITTSPTVTGLSLVTVSGTDFYTDVPCNGGTLDPVTGGISLVETDPGVSGIYQLEFWKPSGAVPTLIISDGILNYNVDPDTFIPTCNISVCQSENIPTLGQWSLFILFISLSIIALTIIKQDSKVTSFR